MILIDNTVLSNFARIKKAKSIPLAFEGDIGTTTQVIEELNRGTILGRLPTYPHEQLQIVTMTTAENKLYQQLAISLGDGEASCLAVASHRKWTVATDDKSGRKWGRRLQIPLTGTLGILVLLVTRKQITRAEGNTWLQEMIKADYRSPVQTLDPLIPEP